MEDGNRSNPPLTIFIGLHHSPEKAIKELTMILLYLSRFKEEGRFATGIDIAWKGYLFDTLNELDDEDYIRQGSHRSKSVAITEEGIALARTLMEKYHIEDWK